MTRWDLAYLRALDDTRIRGANQNVAAIETATAQDVQTLPGAAPTR